MADCASIFLTVGMMVSDKGGFVLDIPRGRNTASKPLESFAVAELDFTTSKVAVNSDKCAVVAVD